MTGTICALHEMLLGRTNNGEIISYTGCMTGIKVTRNAHRVFAGKSEETDRLQNSS